MILLLHLQKRSAPYRPRPDCSGFFWRSRSFEWSEGRSSRTFSCRHIKDSCFQHLSSIRLCSVVFVKPIHIQSLTLAGFMAGSFFRVFVAARYSSLFLFILFLFVSVFDCRLINFGKEPILILNVSIPMYPYHFHNILINDYSYMNTRNDRPTSFQLLFRGG